MWYSTVMINGKTGKKSNGIPKKFYRVVATGLTAVCIFAVPGNCMTVEATTIQEIEEQIKKDQQALEDINSTISSLTDEQDLVEEMIDDLNAEILNMLTSIGLKEDEIAAKEVEIADKQLDIEQAQKDYAAAKEKEEQQYQSMKIRIRMMYENSNVSLLAKILSSKGISGLINSLEIIEKVYQSDNDQLVAYEDTKKNVQELWDQLVYDKAQLEADKAQLEKDRIHLQSLKSELDGQLEKKKAESANYEAEIQRYKRDAATAKQKIQSEQKELAKLQEQLKNQVNTAVNGTYTDKGYFTLIDSAKGSDLGKKIAKYACQYIGNPYVYGGTSLTEGADCSGFLWRIYKNFGYSLPRTSYEQRSAGTGVSYDQAQPGDIICYDGHVGMYIGGGKIVHASSAKTGIKVSNATYRPILAVRRIVS